MVRDYEKMIGDLREAELTLSDIIHALRERAIESGSREAELPQYALDLACRLIIDSPASMRAIAREVRCAKGEAR
jgi:hypothetical protein